MRNHVTHSSKCWSLHDCATNSRTNAEYMVRHVLFWNKSLKVISSTHTEKGNSEEVKETNVLRCHFLWQSGGSGLRRIELLKPYPCSTYSLHAWCKWGSCSYSDNFIGQNTPYAAMGSLPTVWKESWIWRRKSWSLQWAQNGEKNFTKWA